jgi:predicted aldo/keto reductase-like oxidoreductase
MTDVNAVFGKGGAMEALQQAKEQGIVRHLGFTGHFRPDALMECARRFNFDTVLMAVSAADKHHYSFIDELVPMAVEKQMGIIGMKVPGRGRLLTSWNPPPIERQKHMWEGSVIATQPGTVIIGIDSISQLEENVRLAREFTPLSEKQMASISTRAEPVSKQALFFRFMERA